jgi:hypothetical protein
MIYSSGNIIFAFVHLITLYVHIIDLDENPACYCARHLIDRSGFPS